MDYIIWIKDIMNEDKDRIGNVAAQLPASAPNGFVLTYEAFDAHVQNVMDKVYSGDDEIARETILSQEFPNDVADELEKSFSVFKEPVLVRPSANFELPVEVEYTAQGFDMLKKQVKRCYAACFRDECLEVEQKPKVAVIIQKIE